MDEYDDEEDNQTPTPKNGALNFFSRDSSRTSSSASSVNNLFKKTARERIDASSASSRKSGIVASQKNIPPTGKSSKSRDTPINSVKRTVSLRTGSSAGKIATPNGRRRITAKTTDDIRKNSDLNQSSKLILESNAIKSLVCEPCQEQYTDSKAEFYCRKCEEALCESCAATHKNSKITRNHEVLSVDEMSNPKPKSKPDQSPGKPGKPEKVAIESTSCTINWEACEGIVDYYEIRYKEKTSKTWNKVQPGGAESIFTVQNLKGRTAYNFQVRGVFGSILGPFSYVSEPMETNVSLAWRLLQTARKVDDSDPGKYKLELEENLSARNEKAKTRKCVLGKYIELSNKSNKHHIS